MEAEAPLKAWVFIAFIGLMALAAGIHDTRKQIPSTPDAQAFTAEIVISSPLPNSNQYLAQQPGVAAMKALILP